MKFLCFCLLAVTAVAAERIPATKDNSIVLYKAEEHLNAGSKGLIRIKGNQHLVAMDFDWSRLRGKGIAKATLVCRQGAAEISGVTISTLAANWDEHKSSALTSGLGEGWGYGGLFPALTGGNAFTLTHHAKSRLKDGWYHWDVAPELIYANVIGVAHGLTLHEDDVDYSRNPTIHSREQGPNAPYLLIEADRMRAHTMQPPTDLALEGDRLHLTAPHAGFAYAVTVNGQPLPRWNIPLVKPGAWQIIPIRDLPLKPGSAVTISVRTISRTGPKSRPVQVSGRLPPANSVPRPSIPELPPAGNVPKGLFVVPLLDKYHPDGKPVGTLKDSYKHRNAVFADGRIQLRAAPGETVGFMLYVKGRGKVELRCQVEQMPLSLWQAQYVRSKAGLIPDPLVPLGTLKLNPERYTPIAVDIQVPQDARADSRGAIKLSDGRSIPIELRLRRFSLPAKASFLCEMNSYGVPNAVAEYNRLQQIAYQHRAHVNILHYSHNTAAAGARKCNLDMILPTGRRMNEKRYNDIRPGATKAYWDDFVAAFDPVLSGDLFKGKHRGAIAVPGFYLTFHESWPLNLRPCFNGNRDAYHAFEKHPEYRRTFVNILRDFIRTADRQNWHNAGFQVYLNNKGSLHNPRKSPWVLDEPSGYYDYRALAHYADLVREARGKDSLVTIDYRIDISRPQFCRGQLWGKCDLWVVNGGAWQRYPRLLADRREFTGETMWVYGTTNPVEQSNRNTQAWILDAYSAGAKGVVPWQTINKNAKAMTQADQLGLFIFHDGKIHHSLRLKAYRRAQQDVEYLQLLKSKRRWSDEQVRGFVARYLNLRSDVHQAYTGDAGTAQYKVDPEQFRKLREAAAVLINNE